MSDQIIDRGRLCTCGHYELSHHRGSCLVLLGKTGRDFCPCEQFQASVMVSSHSCLIDQISEDATTATTPTPT